MSEFHKFFESLYTDFLLRDLFAKMVPGAVVLLTFIKLNYPQFGLAFDGFPLLLIVGFAGVCWVFGFAIQQLGETTWKGTHSIIKHHPDELNDQKVRYELRDDFAENSSLSQQKRVERYTVIKESTGNMATALVIVCGFILVNWVHGMLAPASNDANLGAILILGSLAWLLIKANRSHMDKQYKFMQTTIEKQTNAKVVVFDFDGVIADSMKLQEKAWIDACVQVEVGGKAKSAVLSNFRKGKSGEQIFEDADLEKDAIVALREAKDCMWYASRKEAGMFPNAKLALQELSSHVTLAIASSAPSNHIREFLNRFELNDYFSVVLSDDQVSQPKPNPEMLISIARQLDLNPGRMVMVGDTENDVEMASAFGVEFIGFKGHPGGPLLPGKSSCCWTELKEYVLTR
jgi:AHBA synthesis associated protein